LCLPLRLLLHVNTAALCGCKNAQTALFAVSSRKKYKIILWRVCFSFTIVRKYLPAQLFYCWILLSVVFTVKLHLLCPFLEKMVLQLFFTILSSFAGL